MVFLDDLKYMKLYKKKFYLPIDKKHKKTGTAILLLTPNIESSFYLMNHPLTVNFQNLYKSYYAEKDIMYTIQHESRALEIAHNDYTQIINEQPSVFIETTDIKNYEDLNEASINELYCKLGDKVIFFNEMYDEDIFDEAAVYSTQYKSLLYNDRIRNNKEMFEIYKRVKSNNPWITKTFINYSKYKEMNLFIDLSYYNQAYLGNNNFTINKSVDMYFEFIRRFINDKRIDAANYTRKVVFVPIDGWQYDKDKFKVYDFLKVLNPISTFNKKMRYSLADFKQAFGDIDFVFLGDNGYFKLNANKLEKNDFNKFVRFIKALENNEPIIDDEQPNSQDAITASIISKIETNKGIQIHDLTGERHSEDEQEQLKTELVKKINNASKDAVDEDQAIERMEQDEDIKRIISDLEEQSEDNIKLSASRLNRINKAQDAFMNKSIKNTTVKEMINTSNKPKELPEKELPIETINTEWKHLKSVNFEKEYDLDADILRCLNSLSDTNKECPVSILNVEINDTSTSEDYINTWTVKCEGFDGKRFQLKFDIPKFRDNRFMRLRGNEKIFSIEMPLLPISKTDPDTVQIATLYNKIFITTYYDSTGKSNPSADRLFKTLNKYNSNIFTTVEGDNTEICKKYHLPIDYIDLASKYSKIEYNGGKDKITIFFNQDEIRSTIMIDPTKGIPYAMHNKEVIYYDGTNGSISSNIVELLSLYDSKFKEVYESTNAGKKFTYSRAKILNNDIPVIVILAHGLGLTKALDIAGINYIIDTKKSKESNWDSIKFADGYISFEETYSSLMLMNGLKDCDLEDVKLSSINSKATWISQLDNFGGRDRADGLDNFKDLMYDPISVDISKDYKLPYDYFEALIYASNLLIDNKYTFQTDLSNNRYRTNEVVAAAFYKALSTSYGTYSLLNRRGKNVAMSIKQSAIIDLILESNTTSDLSIFQPLSEIETKNTISFKGFNGLNSERAYTLEKRGYDESMLNIIAQSTGFASTVGVNRQTTINPNITGGRGYFKQSGQQNINVVNSMGMTEALSPFTITSDDPFRNDMTFVQTSKHSTPIEYGSPLLVTTGADAAMPYLVSDMFAHKAKKRGTVKEITNDYLLVEYDDKTTEYVNLQEQTKKNSDGGFYITLQLKTDLKVGQRVKEDTILAYDKKSFSNRVGDGSQVAYNLGCITKLAIMTSEDGFEDSGIASEWLSEAMASNIVVSKAVDLPASTNVIHLCKVGQEVREGDPLLIFMNAYDEEDANALLKSLNNDSEYISEIGRNTIKSKVTGVISDIKIYRTCDKEELSESLLKIVNKKESEIKKLKNIADKAGNYTQFDSVEKLPQVGKLKNVDGVLIEIYMKYHDKLSVGDKCSTNANKVVLMNIYKDEDSPYTDFRKNEAIDMITSASALDARMLTSPIKGGALYKLMIELSRRVDDIMGIKWKTIHEMYDEDMKNN